MTPGVRIFIGRHTCRENNVTDPHGDPSISLPYPRRVHLMEYCNQDQEYPGLTLKHREICVIFLTKAAFISRNTRF
ncbi:Hypothetical protein GOX0584 [Gluconobacter oxydans 621H]|uniref:Uncharacterized protein n=1 Tax=Gluconobacter oxydans (strain 621H) TaxID=290633 RepID=Q5FTD4_GLUOX|nr:Hypothetical protein GOX0584 [Gluconobacter oxydans 621H]